MTALREWLRRLWGTFRKHPRDAEMEEELRLHLEMAAADLQRGGLSRDDAMREARLQAGGIAQAMERRRDQRGLPWLEDLVHDVRFSARTLKRSPVFTVVALATLTLAIGATTAIFSILDVLVFRDLPVRDPARLVQFTWQYPGDPPLNMFSAADYESYRDRNTVLAALLGTSSSRLVNQDAGTPGVELVTGDYFDDLGVRPFIGRLLEPRDDVAGAAPAAVISWRFWRDRLGADPAVLGKPLTLAQIHPALGDVHAIIVGVAERRFNGLAVGYRPEVWLPAAIGGPKVPLALIGRLADGVSLAQAEAQMRVLDQPRIEARAKSDPQWRKVTLRAASARAGLATPLHQQFEKPLLAVMTIVGALLLLACANVGGMLLARGAARQHEMAVRVALGAGRLRIVRQMLAESLLLAGAGAVLGSAAARLGASVLMRIMTSGTRSLAAAPRIDIPLDARVLVFTVSVALLAAVIFGIVPAVAAFVSAPARALNERGAGGSAPSRQRAGGVLVVAQVAISLALLTVTALSVTHLAHLRGRSLGFERRGVLLVSLELPRSGPAREQVAARYVDALRRLRAIPGVASAAASGMTPISGAAGSRFVRVAGFDEPAPAKRRVFLNLVTPGYFSTYETALVAGRDFVDGDAAPRRRAIVNQAMARHYFAGRDPVGERVWFDNDRDPFEIIGVAADAKYQDVRTPAPETVYLYGPAPSELSLRTTVPPTAIAGDVRRVIGGVLADVSIRRITTLADQVDASIVPERLLATLSGFFGLTGALLAAIGLYGLVAYTVARRTREIGVRLALGATRQQVMRMVLGAAVRLVLFGLLAGAPMAWWGRRAAAAILEHLPPGGLLPFATAAATTMLVALLAAGIPAHRATRVDPVTALRTE